MGPERGPLRLVRINDEQLEKKAVFGMGRRVALVRTDVSEERIASFIRVKRISELGTTLATCRFNPRRRHSS
jgi:hypothetical protein